MKHQRQKALLHIYPDLAGLSDVDRRRVLLDRAGVYSSRQRISQAEFERIMADYEQILWERVAAGKVPDPRNCRHCGARLIPLPGGRAHCLDRCEVRKVYAWELHYWRSRVPQPQQANTRLIWKLRRLWDLLQDHLPPAECNQRYLAGIIEQTRLAPPAAKLLGHDGRIAWQRVTPEQARAVIEALKDRLLHATAKETAA